MPDKFLHGNGIDCPCCHLRRRLGKRGSNLTIRPHCGQCEGTGRIAVSVVVITANAARDAKQHHWEELAPEGLA